MLKPAMLALVVLLTGCATPVATLNVAGIERSESVRKQDLRPEIEKQDKIFSLMISNEAYGLYRVADASLNPPAVRLLQHRAFEKFGTGAAPVDVKVHHLVVYRNLQAALRRSVIGSSLGGVVGAMIAGKTITDPSGVSNSLVDAQAFQALEATEFKRALYTEQENPGRGNVHVVYIETEINGKRVFTRTVAPLAVKEGENPLPFAVEEAIKFHLSQY